MINYLELSGVGIEFDTNGSKFRALQNVNLKLDKGEFVSLIGHSGCGKSTVLNIVAGLYRATEGGVILEGKEVLDPGPDRPADVDGDDVGALLRQPHRVAAALPARRPGDECDLAFYTSCHGSLSFVVGFRE